MPNLDTQLLISRCPHCGVDKPNLSQRVEFESVDHIGANRRKWKVYGCLRCGGVVTCGAAGGGGKITEMYPEARGVDESVPDRARDFLEQAIGSLSSPAGAVMLTASAVDAMLKSKGLNKGNLFSRIEKAAKTHLITPEMAKWANEVRLDANDQRHADEGASLPTVADANKSIDFALALAQFLFVLPSQVTRGLKAAESSHQTG